MIKNRFRKARTLLIVIVVTAIVACYLYFDYTTSAQGYQMFYRMVR